MARKPSLFSTKAKEEKKKKPAGPSKAQQYGAAGVRGLGALLSGSGGWLGAGVSGVAEGAAQQIEGMEEGWDPIDWRRVGAESAVGAIPFAKWIKLSKPVESAVRGAAAGAVAPYLRHGIAEGEWDPREHSGEIATSAAISGGTAGALGALGKVFGIGQTPTVADDIIETTTVKGGRVPTRRGNRITGMEEVEDLSLRPMATVPGKITRPEVTPDAGHYRQPYPSADPMGLASPRVQKVMEKEAREAARAAKNQGPSRTAPEGVDPFMPNVGGPATGVYDEAAQMQPYLRGHMDALTPGPMADPYMPNISTYQPGSDALIEEPVNFFKSMTDLAKSRAGQVRPTRSELRTPTWRPESAAPDVPASPYGPEPIPPSHTIAQGAMRAGAQTGTSTMPLTVEGPFDLALRGTPEAPPRVEPPVGPARPPRQARPGEVEVIEGEVASKSPIEQLVELFAGKGKVATKTGEVVKEGSKKAKAPKAGRPTQGLAQMLAAGGVSEGTDPLRLFTPSKNPQDLMDVLGSRYEALQQQYKAGMRPKGEARGHGMVLQEAGKAVDPEQTWLKAQRLADEGVVTPKTRVTPQTPFEAGLEKQAARQKMSETAKLAEALKVPPKGTKKPKLKIESVEDAEKAIAAGASEADVTKALKAAIAKLKKENAGLAGGESGQIDPELLTRLGLGAAGALTGYATDPLDDPISSAVIGGAAGAGAPSLLKNISTVIDPKKRAEIGQLISQGQKFNMLASGPGLAANAAAGPAGAAFMEGLERTIAGDPRGMKIIQNLFKVRGKDIRSAFAQADKEMGRAESVPLSHTASELEKVLAVPGRAMTTGDIVARRSILESGIPEMEARAATLTSEPESRIGKQLLELQRRGGPLAQILFPFARTPINIFEQGIQRTPGLNVLMKALGMNKTDPRLLAAQNALGLGIGVGAEQLGENLDPETAKVVRRFVSNLAGRYSLPASIAFAGGQAVRNQGSLAEALPDIARSVEQSIPVPTGADVLTPSGFSRRAVPAAFAELAALLDPAERKASGYIENIQKRIPGLREGLKRTSNKSKRMKKAKKS